MTCYYPIDAWAPLSKADGGRLVFQRAKALNPDHVIKVPCGGCIGCRVSKVEDWSTRCAHEAQMHDRNSFLTLTYDDDHYPEHGSVNLRTFQLFIKRLRKDVGTKLRFFGCGEYGSETKRAHYHALIFGYDFHADRKLFKTTQHGPLYASAQLSRIWPYGSALIGSVTPSSAGYVAGYVRKKIGGDLAATHYLHTHPVSGLVVKVEPEFGTQSKKPGLGSTWFDKFKTDAFPSDFIVIDGKQRKVPLYYFRKLQKGEYLTPNQTPEQQQQKTIRNARALNGAKGKANATPERLRVREFVKADRLSRLKETI